MTCPGRTEHCNKNKTRFSSFLEHSGLYQIANVLGLQVFAQESGIRTAQHPNVCSSWSTGVPDHKTSLMFTKSRGEHAHMFVVRRAAVLAAQGRALHSRGIQGLLTSQTQQCSSSLQHPSLGNPTLTHGLMAAVLQDEKWT